MYNITRGTKPRNKQNSMAQIHMLLAPWDERVARWQLRPTGRLTMRWFCLCSSLGRMRRRGGGSVPVWDGQGDSIIRCCERDHVAVREPSVPARNGVERQICKKKKTSMRTSFLLILLKTVLFRPKILRLGITGGAIEFGGERVWNIEQQA